jgi:peptidoglycan-associated lipoprotein
MNALMKTLAILTLAAVLVSLPAAADGECVCKKARPVCKDYAGDTDFRADDVWWGGEGVSYGNYLQFAKADVPDPRKAPNFGIIYYDLDKSVLKPQGIKVCKKVLAYMKKNPEDTIRVEGHCCDLATNEYNMALGRRRAHSVKKYLVENGIDAARITTASYGEERRVTTDPATRPKNRRSEVTVTLIVE